MKRTLCTLRTTFGSEFYLIQNEQNNLEVSTIPAEGQQSSNHIVVIADIDNKFINNFKEKFLSGEVFNTDKASVLYNGERFKSLKDLLEKGLNIPQHQMPNLPNNNQHNQQDQNVVNNNPNVLMDVSTLLYGNEYHKEYEKSDFTIIEGPSELNNGQAIDYSQRIDQTTYYY